MSGNGNGNGNDAAVYNIVAFAFATVRIQPDKT